MSKSGSVETRILEMQLDNDQFEKGIRTTIASLEELEEKLELKDANDGFQKISNAANTMQFGHMESSLDRITDKFTLLGNVGLQALERISNKIVDIGENIVKGITVDPLIDGWQEFEMKTMSTQTILGGIRHNFANDEVALHSIGTELDRLNAYADKTIYSFGQMTENVGKFTNQNIDLVTSVDAMKGIGNWAALVGADASQMSRAMYNISQALGGGSMQLIDWKSIKYANMATPKVQKLLADVAKVQGTLRTSKGKAVKKGSKAEKEAYQSILSDFEKSLKSGWMTNEVMMQAFKILSNEMSDEDWKTLFGDSEEAEKMIAEYKQLGAEAEDAATKVKTFTQLIGVLKESLGSGWATTFEKLFGGFEGQTALWTALSNKIGEFIDKDADDRNTWVDRFVDRNHGFEILGSTILSLTDIFLDFWSVLREVGKNLADPFDGAYFWKSVFGEHNINDVGLTAQSVAGILADVNYALTTFHNWFTGANLNDEDVSPYENVIKIFSGIGAVVGIAFDAISQFARFAMRIGALFLPLISSVLSLFGGLGDQLYSLYANLAGEHTFDQFFEGLFAVIGPVVSAIVDFATAILDLVNSFLGFDKEAPSQLEFFKRLNPLVDLVTKGLMLVPALLAPITAQVTKFSEGVKKGFAKVKKHVKKDGVTPFEDLLDIAYEFVSEGFGKETADTIKNWINENVTGTLKDMVGWMADTWNKVSEFFTNLPENFNKMVEKLKAGFTAFGSYKYDNNLTGLENFRARLNLLLTTLFGEETGNQLIELYDKYVGGALDTIAKAIEAAFAKVERVLNGIGSVFKADYSEAESPFQVLAMIASNFMKGYYTGGDGA